jgi:hypothetical protein
MPKSRSRKPIDHQHRLRMEKRTQRAARHRRQRSATQSCSRRRIHPACQPAATPGCGLPNFQKAVMRQKLGPHLEDVRGARPDTPIKVCRRESKVRFTGTSTKSTGLRAHLIRVFCALESIVFCLDELQGLPTKAHCCQLWLIWQRRSAWFGEVRRAVGVVYKRPASVPLSPPRLRVVPERVSRGPGWTPHSVRGSRNRRLGCTFLRRSRRSSILIDPAEWDRLKAEAVSRGLLYLGTIHSNPDCQGYCSETDLDGSPQGR